jgi:hypothetical protein
MHNRTSSSASSELPEFVQSLKHTPVEGLSFNADQLQSSEPKLFPPPIEDCLIKEFLEFLYPIYPVVHVPTFCRRLVRVDRAQDIVFDNVVQCICVVTLVFMPRASEEFQRWRDLYKFPCPEEAVKRCYELVMSTRTLDYLEDPRHEKWIVAFMLALALRVIGLHSAGIALTLEASQILVSINCHKRVGYGKLNCIEVQLAKKAFWMTYTFYV